MEALRERQQKPQRSNGNDREILEQQQAISEERVVWQVKEPSNRSLSRSFWHNVPVGTSRCCPKTAHLAGLIVIFAPGDPCVARKVYVV